MEDSTRRWANFFEAKRSCLESRETRYMLYVEIFIRCLLHTKAPVQSCNIDEIMPHTTELFYETENNSIIRVTASNRHFFLAR